MRPARAPLRQGLPTRVADDAWRRWLQDFPDRPPATLGAVMIYRRTVLDHLESAPTSSPLSAMERRGVGDDLAQYSRVLQIEQRAGINTTLSSTGLSAANLLGAMFVPGAKIALLAAGFGLAMLTALRTYDARRRQTIIDALVARIDTLSWDLRH